MELVCAVHVSCLIFDVIAVASFPTPSSNGFLNFGNDKGLE